MKSLTARIFCAFVVACSILPAYARASEATVGIEALAGSAVHREPNESSAASSAVIPLVEFEARSGRLQISGESIVPLPALFIGNGPSGIQDIKLNYLAGTVRYWISPRWAVGAGQTLWNQRTKYTNTIAPVEYDASRDAGAQYELVHVMPLRSGAVQASLAVDPRIHARLSWTFEPSSVTRSPVSEQEAQVDAAISYLRPINRHVRMETGVRYINLAAKYDNGEFADANHVAGVFVKVFYALADR